MEEKLRIFLGIIIAGLIYLGLWCLLCYIKKRIERRKNKK